MKTTIKHSFTFAFCGFTMKKFILFILFCILTVVAANSEWESFKLQYGRKYSSPTEEFYRKKIFLDNKMTIDQHNQRFAEGKTTFTLGINQFADMTNQEYNKNLNKHIIKKQDVTHAQEYPDPENPASVDWRDNQCVPGIKDQGQCGNDWALACLEQIDFVNCQAIFRPVSCSLQNLLDCSCEYGNLCCDGGSTEMCYQMVIDYGAGTESSYPYTGNCEIKICKNSTQCTLTNYKDITPIGSERSLETAVATIGPVAAAMDASHASFQLYRSGVYNDPLCSSTQLDHSVLVVGYGVDGDQPYWLIQNSWGVSWGMEGYMELSKDNGNRCGIATQASYGIF